ncbi:MAG: Ig-like domain-containing protein [candidate division KSB1 bacterium]|nr:Ig-like domain-containing protein [candidate division KSB1 bacterium]MDZ7274730.1 Ig-like domain-containing protein [candidate division KSB1 bacterium]MDZ7285555.1 Ig-like domain-containing protein [candidate division KSB1 bacterium]MDZ7298587.1 Ig-like domain-containing protein [candidate division KSB1 bacterium]MDZ7306766.1 Ig-like domain-containing protein [candidate division KSB1 bacterium]
MFHEVWRGACRRAILFSLGFLPAAPALLSQTLPAPHVDSLRQAMQLPEAVTVRWATSHNSVDTIHVSDDFNRPEIGEHWTYDKRYWAIKDGELVLTPAAIYGWRYLALFEPVFNKPGLNVYSVSYRWGRQADSIGIKEGAHALMIDTLATIGSGYWLWHRTNWHEVWLWIIRYGTWEYTWRQGKRVDQQQAKVPNPKAGDVVKAVIRNRPEAVYFDYYVNDRLDATCADTSKEFALNNRWYVGVFIHGEQLNNQVDDFTVSWLQVDQIAPAAVTDLHGVDSTSSALTLEWRAPGDNNWDGQAERYEIRYSTAPITSGNFSAAQLLPTPPVPNRGGEVQRVRLEGLLPYQTYYVALRAFDETGRAGGLSNVAQLRTRGDGIASKLLLAAGCHQNGEAGQTLPQPLGVQVTDRFGAPVSGFAVQFTVIAGNGNLQGQARRTVLTDAQGYARTTWTLGPTPGTNEVEIRADGLSGSPARCVVTATTGSLTQASIVSGARQMVSAGQPSAPLVARFSDDFGNGIVGHAVQFAILTGGGHFANGQTMVQTVTDANGTATATCLAGEVYGDSTVVVASPAASTTPAVQFLIKTAAPDSMAVAGGDQQTAFAGTTLPEPLSVQVFDANGLPAGNFSVTFRIVSGGGRLNHDTTQVRVRTDSSGVARVRWTLGKLAGSQQVNARAEFKGVKLRHSPLAFHATAKPVVISPTLSHLSVSPQTGLPADSQAVATITVTLRNELNQLVSGQAVRVTVSGQHNLLAPASGLTDANGTAVFRLRSWRAGRKTVAAYLRSPALKLADSVQVEFVALPAVSFEKAGGDQQSGAINQLLALPVAVRLHDKLGNPPQPTAVKFEVTAGGGSILANGSGLVFSDSNGIAQARWRLGPSLGFNRLNVSVPGLAAPVLTFTALALITAVEEPAAGHVPVQFALWQNQPNPFNPETNIPFDLPEAALVRLELYDMNGRLVRVLAEEERPAGAHVLRWDGRDQAGQLVHSGVYLYRLQARLHHRGEIFTATRKLLLLQ